MSETWPRDKPAAEVRLTVGASLSNMFTPGTRVRLKADGSTGYVLRVVGDEAQVAVGGQELYLPLEDLEPASAQPQDQLAAGQLGDVEAAFLRLLAKLVRHTNQYDPGSPLSNARLEPKLHQVFVAHRVVAGKVVPRMILADEVGLGKTIEAGLILKELAARQPAGRRVLIVSPASLTRQWQTELDRKFNEKFAIIDGAAAKHFGRDGANPFLAEHNVICSLPFAQMPKRADQIVEAGWDMVVFDEAHRIRRTKAAAGGGKPTLAYKLAERLKDEVTGMLLLSATPMQLHDYELFSMVELVEPGLFSTYKRFMNLRLGIPALNELMRGIDRWRTLSADARSRLLAKYPDLVAEIPQFSGEGPMSLPEREAAKDAVAAKHPLADVLIRNRRRELGIGGERRAVLERVEPSPEESELYEDVEDYIRGTYALAAQQKNKAVGFLMVTFQKMLTSSSNALRSSFRNRIQKLRKELQQTGSLKPATDAGLEMDDPEEVSSAAQAVVGAALKRSLLQHEIDTLENLVERLDRVRDGKVGRAVEVVARSAGAGRKVVIFTQFIETQSFLVKALEANGLRAEAFNGKQSADEKEKAVRAFRDHADVLVSTEAGGEGRNLQFASVLINYDLPWNPMKIEQRIGRLDRIGQTQSVEIYNLVYAGTLEDRIVDVLTNRIRLFEQSVGALDPILGEVEKSIEDIVMNSDATGLAQSFTKYADELARQVEEARLREETLADLALDHASFRNDEANRLLGRESVARTADLPAVIEKGLDFLGGSVADGADGGSVVSLSPKLASRMGFQRTSHVGVFDPVEAARFDDLDFFACGHPLIDSIMKEMELLPGAEVGARRSPEVAAGTWVEILWFVRADLAMTEGKIIRHLVGPDLIVKSGALPGLPLRDRPIETSVPGWVPGAVRASVSQFDLERPLWRADYDARFKDFAERSAERLARNHASQEEHMLMDIGRQREWLRERGAGQLRAEDVKILPARRAMLAKAEERLEVVRARHADERSKAQSRKLAFRGEVLAASLVVGA